MKASQRLFNLCVLAGVCGLVANYQERPLIVGLTLLVCSIILLAAYEIVKALGK